MEIQNHDFDSCFPKVKYWRENVLYQFQGFWFNPKHLQATKQELDHFKPLPNDVILASFPKTGTTWLKALLYSVINRPSSINQLVTNHSHELVPSLEMQVYGRPVANSPPGHFPSNTSSSTRILSTHIPYQILGETLNSSDCRKESLERPEKFFFITYEELKSNPITHVKRLAEFLGCPFVGEDMEKQVEVVVRSCSIETLKNHEVNKSSDVPSWSMVPYDAFFRKGQLAATTPISSLFEASLLVWRLT
ncbi:cytosolic sulfotransferase 9-like [Rhododendron vialii]|uniref:cytosolic sulfotransferase 9-like n=1 Tax=Rhododendron vialii TaxID=182163 RepID=UPI00265E3A25|nr:cytosolic sulfotransferase 9-like [Rhododendron vialii]